MNGFLVGDAGDVEKQKFFVERLGDFIVAKHRSLEHRRSDAAANSDGDRAAEQIEGRTTHEVKELLFGTPYGGLCGLGLLWGHGMTIEDVPPSYSANHAGAHYYARPR